MPPTALPTFDAESSTRVVRAVCTALAALILGAASAAFVWLAPRGFEYTDESFYLLSLIWWREITSSFTLFGVTLGGVFGLLGNDIALFRVFGLCLLLASAAFLTVQTIRLVGSEVRAANDYKALILLVTTAASLQYYVVLGGLRVPSYNLLALCALMVSTGLMLRMVSDCDAGHRGGATAVAHGVVVGLCATGKVSTALLLGLVHLVFFAVALREPRRPVLQRCVPASLAGALLAALSVWLVLPQAFDVMARGLEMSRTIDERYGPLNLLNALRWDVQRQAREHFSLLLGLLALGGIVRVVPQSYGRLLHSLVLFALTFACAASLGLRDWSHAWWLWAVLAWLWACVAPAMSKDGERRSQCVTTRCVALMLLCLPPVFSFGTNGRVLEHSALAAPLAVLALTLLHLEALEQTGRSVAAGPSAPAWFSDSTRLVVTGICMLSLALPSLVGQMRLAFDVGSVYRQRAPLSEQRIAVQVGAAQSALLVDDATHKAVDLLRATAQRVGLAPGTPLQDFTGDGAGIVFLLGARPLATAWMGGGYPGSERAAVKLLDSIAETDLRHAWLLTSRNNPRAIREWKQMVARRLSQESTHRLVATVLIPSPYDWVEGVASEWELELWQPVAR